MYCFKLKAPRTMGKIPKGFELQVPSAHSGRPFPDEVEAALKRAGFTDGISLSYKSAGNWEVKEM